MIVFIHSVESNAILCLFISYLYFAFTGLAIRNMFMFSGRENFGKHFWWLTHEEKRNHSHSASTKLTHISLKSLKFPFSSYRQNIRSEFGTSFVFSRCYYFKRNQRNKNVAREKFRNLLIGRLLFFVTPSYTDSWNGMTWNVVQTGINSRFQCTRGNL